MGEKSAFEMEFQDITKFSIFLQEQKKSLGTQERRHLACARRARRPRSNPQLRPVTVQIRPGRCSFERGVVNVHRLVRHFFPLLEVFESVVGDGPDTILIVRLTASL